MQIHHVENKFGPTTLLSAINLWRTNRPETVHTSDVKVNEAGSSVNFLSGISEEVSTQLHAGLMKATRRVLLDEIISNIISEFVSTKKAQRHLKPDLVNQDAKIYSSGGKVVMYTLYNFQRITYGVYLFSSKVFAVFGFDSQKFPAILLRLRQ